MEDRPWIEKVLINVVDLYTDVDLSMVAQSGSFPGFCMELLKNPEFARGVNEQIEAQALAAFNLFQSSEEEKRYREALLENIDKDVIRHLLRDEEAK